MNLIELLKEAFDRFTGQIPEEKLLENFIKDYEYEQRSRQA